MKKFIDSKLLEESFGWSWRAWAEALYGLDEKLLKKIVNSSGRILEIGASKNSQIATIFQKASFIELGVYANSKLYASNKSFLENKFELKKNIKIIDCDINNFYGKYNLIVMKSVLGGVFRDSKSSNKDVLKLINKIVKNHLLKDGYLVTLDNGIGFLHSFRNIYGAKKSKWRFFEPNSFKTPYLINQSNFGFFSSFSISSRIPIIGKTLEKLLYLLDTLLLKLEKSNKSYAAIIISVYKNII